MHQTQKQFSEGGRFGKKVGPVEKWKRKVAHTVDSIAKVGTFS